MIIFILHLFCFLFNYFYAHNEQRHTLNTYIQTCFGLLIPCFIELPNVLDCIWDVFQIEHLYHLTAL